MPGKIDTEMKSEVICPWCGEDGPYSDAYDLEYSSHDGEDGEGLAECSACGKKFSIYAEMVYTTERVKDE